MDIQQIDGEELPFTEEEFYRAFRLLHSEDEAREVASYISALVRDTDERSEAAREARARGSTNPHEIAEPTWVIGDEAFALLALVSHDLRIRVDEFMRKRRESERPAITRAVVYRSGRLITSEPTPEDAAAVDVALAAYSTEWTNLYHRMSRRIRRRPRKHGGSDKV